VQTQGLRQISMFLCLWYQYDMSVCVNMSVSCAAGPVWRRIERPKFGCPTAGDDAASAHDAAPYVFSHARGIRRYGSRTIPGLFVCFTCVFMHTCIIMYIYTYIHIHIYMKHGMVSDSVEPAQFRGFLCTDNVSSFPTAK